MQSPSPSPRARRGTGSAHNSARSQRLGDLLVWHLLDQGQDRHQAQLENRLQGYSSVSARRRTILPWPASVELAVVAVAIAGGQVMLRRRVRRHFAAADLV